MRGRPLAERVLTEPENDPTDDTSDGRQVARSVACAPPAGNGQRRHPQNAIDQGLVCSAPALSRALHVDLGVLAPLEEAIGHSMKVNTMTRNPSHGARWPTTSSPAFSASVCKLVAHGTSAAQRSRPEETTLLCPHEMLEESDSHDGPGNHPHGDGQGGMAPQQ